MVRAIDLPPLACEMDCGDQDGKNARGDEDDEPRPLFHFLRHRAGDEDHIRVHLARAARSGRDMHDRNFQQFQDRHAWMLDQALSALLDDLDQRGMLDETVVVAVGEFGRTPKINGKAGRDHWHQCYSGLVAGGGLRSGLTFGASDPRGEFPVSSPVTPADLFTTVLGQIGIGTTQLTSAGLLPQGQLIEDLIG